MVTVSNISKSYGEKKIIDSFSYVFEDGFYLVSGPSGSGKTTLLRLIAGLEAPDSGTVFPIGGAFLFQEKRLIESFSGLKNITSFFGRKSASKALALADKLGLTVADMKKPVRSLSGGMAERVSLVRLILFARREPGKTVFLDEPFTGLDEETAGKTALLLKNELASRTVLVASHTVPDALRPFAGTVVLS